MIADLSVLVQQCAPNVGQTTMMAIIRTESGGNPWAIGDNTSKLIRQPSTKEEAVAVAKALIGLGHNIDMGLGQINSKNLKALGLTPEKIFEPCINLTAAASILSDAYQRSTKQHGAGQQALLAALSAYNTGNLTAGFGNGYVQRVVNNAGQAVAFKIPSLAAGTVIKGKNGSVRIDQAGRVSPYNAPLDTGYGRKLQETARNPVDPRFSPLEATGWNVVAAKE